MALLDKYRIYDGASTHVGGMDAGRDPRNIGRGEMEQVELGENVTFRGGPATNRPAITKMEAIFENPNMGYGEGGGFAGEETGVPNARNNFILGMFQEASYYKPAPGQEYIMASINGHYYRIKIGEDTYSIRDIRLPYRNSRFIPISYHVQAAQFHIVQDDESAPIIFDGISARRAVAGEIFTGRMMAYGQGRIVLIGKDGLVYFGDIFDGKGHKGRDVLDFTETTFLNEGGPSAIPPDMGQPTAVLFIPAQDSATGTGDCLVFGEEGIESFNLGIERSTWKDSQFQHSALKGAGNHGHRNATIVNSDVWFRAKDGWRTYRQARAEINSWNHIPLSTNVKPFIDLEPGAFLEFGSSIAFDNRLLCTNWPTPNRLLDNLWAEQRTYHNGILALDFDSLSSFGQSYAPSWDGRWTRHDRVRPLKVLQLVTGMFAGRSRAFAFCIDDGGLNSLYEVSVAGINDDGERITSLVRYRSMDFKAGGQSTEFNEKLLYGGEAWIKNVAEPVNATVRYRPDQVPDWQPWTTFEANAIGAPAATSPGLVPTQKLGYTPRVPFPKADDEADDESTLRIFRRGYEIQPEIEWTGHMSIDRIRIEAIDLTEKSRAETAATPTP